MKYPIAELKRRVATLQTRNLAYALELQQTYRDQLELMESNERLENEVLQLQKQLQKQGTRNRSNPERTSRRNENR